MAKTHFSGPIVHGPSVNGRKYGYRTGLGMMNSAEFTVFHDDFLGTASSNVPGPNNWTAIIDTGATLTMDTALGEKSGVVVIASDGTAEGVSIYMPKAVLLESDKKFFMEVRVYTEDADDTDVQFGLSDLSATTDPEDMWDTSNADGVAMGVLDGSADLKAVYDKDNGGPVTDTLQDLSEDTLTLADATWTTLAFGFNGANLSFYKNGIFGGNASTPAQVPDDELLAPFIGARTGGAAGHKIYFDYVRWVQER